MGCRSFRSGVCAVVLAGCANQPAPVVAVASCPPTTSGAAAPSAATIPDSVRMQPERCPPPRAAASGERFLEDVQWPMVVKTKQELKALGFARPEWKEFQYKGMDLAFAAEDHLTSGESYIDVYGYVYNHRYQEWRQFFRVMTRGAGALEVRLDSSTGWVSAVGLANNGFQGKPLFRFDLSAVHDDR